MSGQNTSKSVRGIPENLIAKVKAEIGQEVTSIQFREFYRNKAGHLFEVFVVNGKYVISIIDSQTVAFPIKTIEEENKEKQAFGRRVKTLQSKGEVPYDLAKMAARKYPYSDEDALRLLFWIKRAKPNGEEGKQRLRNAVNEGQMREIVSMMIPCISFLKPKEEALVIKYWLK